MPLDLPFTRRWTTCPGGRTERICRSLRQVAASLFHLAVGAVVGSEMATFIRPWLACAASFLKERRSTRSNGIA